MARPKKLAERSVFDVVLARSSAAHEFVLVGRGVDDCRITVFKPGSLT
jgi:hypothetical protein